MDKRAMFKIGYGLYVVTAKSGERQNGCISNSVMQVTSEPNRIVVCLNKNNFTTAMIEKTKELNVSVLSEKSNFDIFKHFGFQSGKDVDKFADFMDVKTASNGINYIIQNTNAYFSCKVIDETDLGTHILFLCDVTEAEILSDDPTCTYDYYQKNIKTDAKPKTSAKVYWKCKVCGYIYEGDPIPDDFICPWCKHGADSFERIVE